MRRSAFAVVLVAAQVTLYAVAWQSVKPKESDFPAFYSAARIWQKGGNPYNLQTQCAEEIPIRGEPCLPFAHPPVLLPLVALVSNDDFESSYHRWGLILLVVLPLCVAPFYQLSHDWRASLQSVLFMPVFLAIALGQDTPLILLGVLLWAWLLTIKKDVPAGLVLSLAVVKPQIAVLLALPLLFSRPKAFAGFCLGGLILTAYSFALVGAEGFRGLIFIMRLMSHGEGFGVNSVGMFNATGLLVRAGISAAWGWPIFALGLIGIALLWRKAGTSLPALNLGIILALFCAPHLHGHDLSLLSIPILLVNPLAPALASALLVASYAFGLKQWAGYCLMIVSGLAQVKVIYERKRSSSTCKQAFHESQAQ